MANELEKTNENSEQNANPSESEAKIKALEAEIVKLKQSVTNASADASKWKKEKQEVEEQLKSKMTEEERKRAEQESAYAAMQEKVTALETERNIANFMATLGASDIGMDIDTAKYVAEALNSGETDKVFDGIRKFIVSHDKAMAEKAMLNNPTLPGGNSTKTVTKAEFDEMGLEEMLAFHNEHPDLYREYMNKS